MYAFQGVCMGPSHDDQSELSHLIVDMGTADSTLAHSPSTRTGRHGLALISFKVSESRVEVPMECKRNVRNTDIIYGGYPQTRFFGRDQQYIQVGA